MTKTEYEVRVLNIDKEKIIAKLEKLNAKKIDNYNYRRYVYNLHPEVYEKWIRLRTDGKETTLTIKEIQDYTISGTKETEIMVSDFDTANEILNQLGYMPKSYQENIRSRYILDEVEIDIDTWPLIPTYLEVEAENEEKIYKILDKLEIKKDDITTLDVEGIFREIYGINISVIPVLKFE